MKKTFGFFAVLLVIFILSAYAYAADLPNVAMSDNSNERVRLGIMNFASKVYEVPDAMAAGISDYFARLLFKADDIMLVERELLNEVASELRLGMSGLIDPKSAAQIGKLAGAEYMLLGSITNLGHTQSGGFVPIPFVAVSTSAEKVKADIDIRVVKVETGEIVLADSASGIASKSTTGLATAWFGVQNSEFSGIEGNAIFNAAAQLAPKIQKALTGNETLSSILAEEFKQATKASKKTKSAEQKKTTTAKKRKTQKADKTVVPDIAAETPASSSEAAETSAIDEKISVSNVSTAEAERSANKKNNYENYSTDPAKVIPTYDLSSGAKNTLRVRHLNLRKYGLKKNAYDEFVKLFEEYNSDYLAAYKAGEVAQALRDTDNAKYWYDKALEINPDYEPAKKAKANLEAAPSKSKAKSSKRKK